MRAALLTIVVVGGGPTGVEMAGAIAELTRYTLRGNFRHIDPASAKVILVEAGPRILGAFPDALGNYAVRALQQLGVDVRLNCAVRHIDEAGVQLGEELLAAATVIWGAGIRAAPAAKWLGGTDDRADRIGVTETLEVLGHPDVFAIGDAALVVQAGQPLPALAQVAQQQGQFLGKQLRRHHRPVAPFIYRTKGDTAVIGRHAAVYVLGGFNLKGRIAWLLWAIIHVYLLIGFERRTRVMLQWIWRYFTYQRGARLID